MHTFPFDSLLFFSSLDLFPNESSVSLSTCYLQCIANTPLLSIEKFLRIKYSLSSTLKVKIQF
jgi:hypothetical protein